MRMFSMIELVIAFIVIIIAVVGVIGLIPTEAPEKNEPQYLICPHCDQVIKEAYEKHGYKTGLQIGEKI